MMSFLNQKMLSVVAGSLLVSAVSRAEGTASSSLNLVPWPREVEQKQGGMKLSSQSKVVAGSPELAPLAKVVSEEIQKVTGLGLQAANGKPAAGDILLQLDSSLKGEEHLVGVTEKGAVVRGGTYQAVALGTTTLLQALQASGDAWALPQLMVKDSPSANYRGLMVDVARQPHSIANLKQIVNLCRLYKVRYLQLHLTDDSLWMFPSKAFPLLGTKNNGKVPPYTEEELKDLVAYADARGVTIVPEIDVPGHCGSLVKTMPELFQIAGTKPYLHHASINFAKPEVVAAIETIIGEVCGIFKSSPYFHIGGDEADLAFANQNAEFQALMKEQDMGVPGLYRRFLVQMNDVVKKHGKRTIVWEGFHREQGKMVVPKDVIVMAYEIQFYMPNRLVEDGYDVINASWTPMYVVKKKVRPPSEIYAWNMFQFKKVNATPEEEGVIVPKTDKVLGAQVCAWEQTEEMEIPSLRGRVPAMAERVWNSEAGKDFADFEKRFTTTDQLLEKLIN